MFVMLLCYVVQGTSDAVVQPTESSVSCKQQPGGFYAVVQFNGVATPQKCREAEQNLRSKLVADGLKPEGSTWWLARYNDPSVKPQFRRNEVLIPLVEFDLWS